MSTPLKEYDAHDRFELSVAVSSAKEMAKEKTFEEGFAAGVDHERNRIVSAIELYFYGFASHDKDAILRRIGQRQ